MLTATEVLDKYFLDVRCMLLEVASTLDRHDAARQRDGTPAADGQEQLDKIYRSLDILADRKATPDRAEQLLNVFGGHEDGTGG